MKNNNFGMLGNRNNSQRNTGDTLHYNHANGNFNHENGNINSTTNFNSTTSHFNQIKSDDKSVTNSYTTNFNTKFGALHQADHPKTNLKSVFILEQLNNLISLNCKKVTESRKKELMSYFVNIIKR